MDRSKQTNLHLMVQLGYVDDNFTDAEKAAIRRLGYGYGLDNATITKIMEHPDLRASPGPMDRKDKMDLLIDGMSVLLADAEIHEKEDRFMRDLATRLGFSDQVVTFLMEYHTMDRAPLHTMMRPYLLPDQ